MLGEPRREVRVSNPSFSPDGNTIAVGFEQSDRLELWELSSKLVNQLQIVGCYTTNNISFSPDGSTIAISTWSAGFGIIKLRE
jgi:WD40 repeat protein